MNTLFMLLALQLLSDNNSIVRFHFTLPPHEFSAVKSTYSSELSYMRSATLEHKDWMQASHVGAVASFV